jgi:dTDP-4-amino-4,6-dideoxygalactose transaminase
MITIVSSDPITSFEGVMTMSIKFLDPCLTGHELHNIAKACFGGRLGEDGEYADGVAIKLGQIFGGSAGVVVTTSVGSSFDLVADLIKINHGDEVVLPSFTYVSAANAFAKRGATLRFVDIEENYLNISGSLAAEIMSEKTKIIIVPHYAGVAANVSDLVKLAAKKGILIVEDVTGAFMGRSDDQILGTLGDFACGSFHEDEFVHSGEAGFLIINNEFYRESCDVLKYRGTEKSLFQKGAAGHYGWSGLGGEYCANEITCAFLYAQLDRAEASFEARRKIWKNYQEMLSAYNKDCLVKYVNDKISGGNFYIKLPAGVSRAEIISGMRRVGIESRGHFYPLHLTKAGKLYGNYSAPLSITEVEHEKVVRLPSHLKISEPEQERVIKILLRLTENSHSENQSA